MKKKLSSFLQITALAKNEWRPAALHGIGRSIGAFASQPPSQAEQSDERQRNDD
jgi:hypothetical protein